MQHQRRSVQPVRLFRSLCAIVFLFGSLFASTATAERPIGIDVSYWQGNISQTNWNTVASSSGRTFVFVRASHLDSTGGEPDPYFANNMTRAKNAGLYAGAYHYATPDSYTAVYEANYFLDQAHARNYIVPGYMRPVLDVEGVSAAFDKPTLSQWANDWIDRVKSETGVEAMIYSNSSYSSSRFDSSVASRSFWVANWLNPLTESWVRTEGIDPPAGIGVFSAWAFWQYSNNGNTSGFPSVPGIGTRVDLDVFNGTLDELRQFVIGTISRSPTTLSQSVRSGRSVPSQTFSISNSGAGNAWLLYDLSLVTDPPGGTWVNLSATSGDIPSGSDTITVSYPTANMAIGTYSATITISSKQAASQTIPVTLTVVPVPGDLDHDGHVNGTDFDMFYNCFTGPNVQPVPDGCDEADMEPDLDVDQSDFAIMQRCFSGAAALADPDCTP